MFILSSISSQEGSFVCDFLSKVTYDGLIAKCETCGSSSDVASLFRKFLLRTLNLFQILC